MPKLHQNTFVIGAPAEPSGGAYALRQDSIAAMGSL